MPTRSARLGPRARRLRVHRRPSFRSPSLLLVGVAAHRGEQPNTDRTRGMWTHVYPHLVATADLPTAITELENRDLTGIDVARPPQLHQGYVGEYPYGHHHGEALNIIDHEWREPLSVPTAPRPGTSSASMSTPPTNCTPSHSTYPPPTSSAPLPATSTGTAT